jgi:hypothetical protein
MIITTCGASPGGLPADARNFSFPNEESPAEFVVGPKTDRQDRFPVGVRIPIAQARDSGQQ